jgi:hypothetical protein
MRLTKLILAYFLIGAVMWGGGVVDWQDAGVGQLIIQDAGSNPEANQQTADQLSSLGGPIQLAASTVEGAGLIAVWNILVKIIAYFNWPIVTLLSVDAPPRVAVIFGGTPVVAFYGAFIRLVRSSA